MRSSFLLLDIFATYAFITLLFFGWLWGAWGLLLGAPLAALSQK